MVTQQYIQVPGVAALPGIQGPVFIKYNAASRNSYAALYTGTDRGVLLSFGQEQIGHLPLGLFEGETQKVQEAP